MVFKSQLPKKGDLVRMRKFRMADLIPLEDTVPIPYVVFILGNFICRVLIHGCHYDQRAKSRTFQPNSSPVERRGFPRIKNNSPRSLKPRRPYQKQKQKQKPPYCTSWPSRSQETFTAKSVAEVYQRLLYTITCGELGINLESLGHNLDRSAG